MSSVVYTIGSVKQGLEKGEFSAEEIHNHYLNKIKKENKELNAFLKVFDYNTDLQIDANATNSQISKSYKLTAKSLNGVPCAIKDNILIDGTVCTAGSKILENYISAYDATVIQKLRAAGVNFLGKTNLDEFAMGSSTENSAFGPSKNPHDLARVPGGSSGGSAVAVAADLCVFALGSDTGGSIRQPAAFCGVVGLKPTYGRVSRHGLIAMASSLDQIGPITKNVYDSALVLNVISSHDVFDSTTVLKEVPDFTKGIDGGVKGLKVGVPKEYFKEGLDHEVKLKVQSAIAKFQSLGAEIIDISLPHSEYALAVYYIIMPSEVSSNLARFDGIRYGHSTKKADNLLNVYSLSRAEGFGDEPKRRIMLGTYALSSGYYDAYYLKAQQVRALIKQDFDKAFEKVDVIIGPTTPTPAFKLGEKSDDPLLMYLSDIYTVPANLAGIPAISVPCGVVEKEGKNLPVGLQILGRAFDEATILRAAYGFEQAT